MLRVVVLVGARGELPSGGMEGITHSLLPPCWTPATTLISRLPSNTMLPHLMYVSECVRYTDAMLRYALPPSFVSYYLGV